MAAVSLVRWIILTSAAALAACGSTEPEPAGTAATTPDTPASSPAEPVASAESPAMTLPVDPAEPADCNVPQAAIFAGREASSRVRAELAAAVAPITAIRWVGPGDATTEDYRPRRLNIMLDVGGTIVSAHCG